jgi:hypothetical protein
MFRCLLSWLYGQGLAPLPISSAQCGLYVLGRTPLPRRLVPLRLDLTSSRGKKQKERGGEQEAPANDNYAITTTRLTRLLGMRGPLCS